MYRIVVSEHFKLTDQELRDNADLFSALKIKAEQV